MDKCRVCDQVQKFHGLRQEQNRGCCKQHRACEGDNGAYVAEVVRLLVWFVVRRRQLLLGGLDRRRGLRRNRVEMTERKRELNGKR